MIQTYEAQIELLTPAFLGSAEPRKVDSWIPLRPSTVRGLLRHWFRAAAGALLWPTDATLGAKARALAAMKAAETALFGDTKRASNLVVLPSKGGATRRFPSSETDPAQHPGMRYLGYGIFDDRNVVPEALETRDKPLLLKLGLRREEAGTRELLGATIWLWIALGGLGARSRRGFGSMAHAGGGEKLGWPAALREPAEDHKALIDQILQGLDWATEVFRQHLPKLTNHPLETGEGPLLALRTLDGIDKVTVLPVDAPSGMEALERAGRLFRDFRGTLARNRLGMTPLPDYFAVKSALQGRRAPTDLGRAAFGLPLNFYFRSLGGAKAQFLPDRGDRLASPLSFRVHALGRGKGRRFVMVLVNIAEANGASPLLGRKVLEAGMQNTFAAPDGRLITQFISWALAEAARAPWARGRQP